MTYRTAIVRKKLPLPHLFLQRSGHIKNDVLDYGCGKCGLINPSHWDSYDPHFYPHGIKKSEYKTILCCYVLNTLGDNEIKKVIEKVKSLLHEKGNAYFSVRRDLNKILHKDTPQRYILGEEFGLKSFYCKPRSFEIYHL